MHRRRLGALIAAGFTASLFAAAMPTSPAYAVPYCASTKVCVFSTTDWGGSQFNFTPSQSDTTFPFTAKSYVVGSSVSGSVDFKDSQGQVLFTATPGSNSFSSPGAIRAGLDLNHNETVLMS